MRPEDRDSGFLWDMLEAIRAIQSFLEDRGAVDLAEDTLLRSAVHWQVIVLGEAARRVSRELRESTPVVDWPLLFIQRNFYAHEYDRATPGELHVVLSQLPGLAVALDELLARRPPPIEPPNLR